jgi:hypothetical protein
MGDKSANSSRFRDGQNPALGPLHLPWGGNIQRIEIRATLGASRFRPAMHRPMFSCRNSDRPAVGQKATSRCPDPGLRTTGRGGRLQSVVAKTKPARSRTSGHSGSFALAPELQHRQHKSPKKAKPSPAVCCCTELGGPSPPSPSPTARKSAARRYGPKQNAPPGKPQVGRCASVRDRIRCV